MQKREGLLNEPWNECSNGLKDYKLSNLLNKDKFINNNRIEFQRKTYVSNQNPKVKCAKSFSKKQIPQNMLKILKSRNSTKAMLPDKNNPKEKQSIKTNFQREYQSNFYNEPPSNLCGFANLFLTEGHPTIPNFHLKQTVKEDI